jgi:hypothetical protein
LSELTSKEITPAAQNLVRLWGQFALGALDIQIKELSIRKNEVMQKGMLLKTEELLPNHRGVRKYAFKCWNLPASKMRRGNGDTKVDIAKDITDSTCQAPTEPERDHLLLLPESHCYLSDGFLLGEIWQVFQI